MLKKTIYGHACKCAATLLLDDKGQGQLHQKWRHEFGNASVAITFYTLSQ